MEFDQNHVNLTTQVSCDEGNELNYVSSPLNHDAKSPAMLENTSDLEDNGSRNEILRREDATESKLDEMVDMLMDILNETITILGAAVNEDSDNDCYVLSDPKGPNESVVSDDAIILNQNSEDNQSVGCQTETTDESNESITLTVSKNQDETTCELNELTESLMLVLMLCCLYYLLSSMV